MLPLTIVPSLPANSFSELRSLVERLEEVIEEFQVDMVDGHFVPTQSWPFTEEEPRYALDKLKSIANRVSIEVDCMLMHPEQYLDLFAELGIKRVLVHAGTTEMYDRIFAHAGQHGYEVGVAVTNDTPLQSLGTIFDSVSYIQVMGIKTVGAQGQPFDERTLDTVRRLRSQFPDYTIAVDGSVNSKTITALKEAGANRFAPGSAVAQANDPIEAYQQLRDLVAHT